MGKTSIASCGWYTERRKRFSVHSLRLMGGRSAPLTCARIAPVPGSHVCVAYERCVRHESDSRHSGHAPASGALRQGYAAANAAIRGRWPRAGYRATPKGRTGFLNGADVPRGVAALRRYVRFSGPRIWRVRVSWLRVWLSRRYGTTRVSGVLVARRLARKEKGRVLGSRGRTTGGVLAK